MEYIDKIIKLIKTGHIKTKYSHHNLVYRRLRQFIFSVDCSGLMEFWLKKKYPQALAEIYDYVYQNRNVPKCEIKRLYSFDFYDFFLSLNNDDKKCSWKKVDITKPLQRGDVIAFINPLRKWRFGHVAIVDSEIKRTSNLIRVKVIDSSQIEHCDDYRQSNKKGIGKGTIELYLENNDVVSIGYMPGQIKPRLAKVARLR